ncbi:MAG: IS66 family transposase [Paracoccaceae bacterium]|nr:IS66 family transposase [Paracoccaceae bacterium]
MFKPLVTPNISGLVTYLNEEQHIPVNRVVDVMEQFHGFRMSGGTVVNMVAGKARQFGGLADWIRHLVAFSRVKYMDETGSRIAGRTGWLHVACNEYMTCLWIGKSRGDVMRDARGTIVHDFFPSYQTIPDVRHGYCNVHVLRELEDLVEFAGEGWAGDAAKLLQEGIHLHNEAGGNELPPGIIASLGKRYRCLIGKGLRFHESREPLPSAGKRGRKRKRRGHNLALRLDKHADGVLLYLSDPLVEPTNNYAEQALRPEKLKQKISGCHRSLQGARDTAIIRTVLATARKQGWNALDTLRSTPGELMAKLVTGPMVDTEPIA